MTTLDEREMEQAAAEALLVAELEAAEAAWYAYVDYMESLQDSLGYEDHDKELPW
jgi:hypothetical protein